MALSMPFLTIFVPWGIFNSIRFIFNFQFIDYNVYFCRSKKMSVCRKNASKFSEQLTESENKFVFDYMTILQFAAFMNKIHNYNNHLDDRRK
jgi:hypothetical protein